MTPALALNRGVEPHAGLFVQAVPAGGSAQRAGLKEKDVIIAVGDTPVANRLDFELGLFKVRKAQDRSPDRSEDGYWHADSRSAPAIAENPAYAFANPYALHRGFWVASPKARP